MDSQHFDQLTRILATASRRRVFTGALASGVIAVLPGFDGEDAFGKKRKKKKKKQTSGCKDEDCFGSRRCRNGVCACPEGLQDCDGQFWCGECCTRAECPGFPDANSLFCANEEAGSDILVCRCLNGVHCGNGRCVECCNSDYCLLEYGPRKFCNVNGGCACPQGTSQCSKEQGCRDTMTDRDACGINCIACGPGRNCENGNCCVGLANPCVFNDDCCSGLGCVNIGTPFELELVCGTVP